MVWQSVSVSVVPRDWPSPLRRQDVGGCGVALAGFAGIGLGVDSAAAHNWQTVKPFLWHFRCVLLASLQPFHRVLLFSSISLAVACPCRSCCCCLLWQKFIPQAFELHFITPTTSATGTASGIDGRGGGSGTGRNLKMQMVLAPYWKLGKNTSGQHLLPTA